MTIEAPLQYDPKTPHTSHPGLASAMYGEMLHEASSVLNIAAGNTDLEGDLLGQGIAVDVTSLDPKYPVTGSPDAKPDRVRGIAQKMPFADESFDMTLWQYGAQHIPTGSHGDVVREMVRVTKPADDVHDQSKGVLIINPVYRSKQLKRALDLQGLGDVAGIWDHDDGGNVLFTRRDLVNPTLIIRKTDRLSGEKLDQIIAAVTDTKALKSPHKSLGEMVSRASGGRSSV